MTRTYFSKGLKGLIAKRIQTDLLRQGFTAGPLDKFIDGDFGGHTVAALTQLQTARNMSATGAVDEPTWQQLTHDPLPTLFERCLSLTASFEGHGFGLLQGNFDGAGLTWGIIGYTLSNGEIQALLAAAEAAVPGTLARVMGPLAAQWQVQMGKPGVAQITWADSISSPTNKANVPPEWRSAFARLGDEPIIKRLQMERAYQSYFVPATATAQKLKMTSELGIALAFDMHVQNGGSRVAAVAAMQPQAGKISEAQMRRELAQKVAANSAIAWQADVLARKLTVATGQGTTHGSTYTLAAWGLGEFDAA
jgi:hypothetical protein